LAEWHDGRLFGLFACPHHRDYFPVWRPAFDTLLADDAADAARHIQCLAERMCRLSSATADRLEALVREEEAVAPLHPDRVEVTPAPRVTIDLHLVRWSPTFAQLEATFGPATALPPTGADASRVHAWEQRWPRAPNAVAIFARFHTAPPPCARPFGVLLRIDPL
jgi:hypothetical protein